MISRTAPGAAKTSARPARPYIVNPWHVQGKLAAIAVATASALTFKELQVVTCRRPTNVLTCEERDAVSERYHVGSCRTASRALRRTHEQFVRLVAASHFCSADFSYPFRAMLQDAGRSRAFCQNSPFAQETSGGDRRAD